MAKMKNNNPKKNRMAIFYEILAVLLFLGLSAFAFKEHNPKEFLNWFFIPLIPFVLSIFYNSKKIGENIKGIGIGIVGIFTFLDSVGINGLPAIALLLFLGLITANYYSPTKTVTEMTKIVFGILAGSLTQAKISTHKQNKK